MTYKVDFDYTNFKNLSMDDEELMYEVGDRLGSTQAYRTFTWDNISLADVWEPIPARFVDVDGLPTDKVPDITVWRGSCLFLSPFARKALEVHLEGLGEYLPVPVGDDTYFVFNCMNEVQADKSQSEADIRNELWLGVKSIGFKKEDVATNLIFKTKFNRGSALYCGEDFKALIEANNLAGVQFIDDLVDGF